jgi:ferritin
MDGDRFTAGVTMLISANLTKAINAQIGYEFFTSMQYTAIAAYFGGEALPELSRHFVLQAEEERTHALKLVNYVVDSGGKMEIPVIESPKSEFGTAEEACKMALDSELTVTKQINDIMNLAVDERDHLAQNFMQWFVTEQLEEVSTAESLLRIVQRAGENGLLFVADYLARNGLAASQPSSTAP